MKIIASIFSLLILFMPLQPVIGGINCMLEQMERAEEFCCKKTNCCAGMEMKKKKSPLRSCDKKNCPIEICNCCYYIAINRLILEKPSKILKREKIRPANENSLSTFISDCFHPPEFV